MSSRWSRIARGWSAAAFATLAAAVSHTLAGASAPTPFGMLASIMLAGTVCTFLVGRSLSMWRLAAAIGLSQALFHGVFSSVGATSPTPHVHGTLVLPHIDGSDGTVAMWIGHAIAALITLAVFRYGERSLSRLGDTARLLFARLTSYVDPVRIPVARHTVATVATIAPRRRTAHLSVLRHRGPPVSALAS